MIVVYKRPGRSVFVLSASAQIDKRSLPPCEACHLVLCTVDGLNPKPACPDPLIVNTFGTPPSSFYLMHFMEKKLSF